MLVEVLEKVRGIVGRTVIVCQAPGVLRWAIGDVLGLGATTTCPPATGCIGGKLGVSAATARLCGLEVRDLNARVLDLLDPLLNLRRVGRRSPVQGRIVGRGQDLPWNENKRSEKTKCGNRKLSAQLGMGGALGMFVGAVPAG